MANQKTITAKQKTITANQKTITWKAEVEFVGKVEEFVKFTEALAAVRAQIDVGKIINKEIPDTSNGYVAPRFIDTARINEILSGAKLQRIAGLINGGIRTPHFHIGKEIVLVDRDQFKTILGEVARDVFEHRALQKEDYLDVICPLIEIEK